MATISAESSTIIDRPLEDVWAFVSDPRNEPKWHTDILEIKSAADQAGGPGKDWVLGERLLVTVQFMGPKQYEVEVTAKEANQRLEITTRTGPIKPVATYLFERSSEGTRFTRHVDIPLEGSVRLLQPLMRRNTQKRNARFVQNLKRLLEGNGV
jgi:uncharacterized protein YndB with AHSA1/START domain